jgi:hypothetical protein
MKRSLLLALLCVASSNLYSLDRNAFTITSYRLEVEIDRPSHVMAVNGRLVLRNESNLPQNHLALQVTSSLQWNMIGTDEEALDCKCDGERSRSTLEWLGEPYTSDIDHTGILSEAIVTLGKNVPPGGRVAIDIQYGGTVTADATRLTRMGLPEQLALHSDWDQISEAFTAVRGLGHVVWYPVSIEAVSMSDGNAVSDAIARWQHRHRNSTFDAKISVEMESASRLAVVTNVPGSGVGGVEPRQLERDGRSQTVSFASATLMLNPLTSEVPAFAIANYDTLFRPAVEVLFAPEQSLIAKDYAAAAEASESLLDNWLPQTETHPMRVIELTEPDANPYQEGASLFTPLASVTQPNLQLLLLPTQVSARFANTRPWMQQGLGLFLQAILNRERGGRDEALKFLDQYEGPLAKVEELARSGNSADRSSQPKSDSDNTLLNTSDDIYLRVKGGFVFWMLHDMLGETTLQHALAAYRASADREPTYFQKLLEAQSKHDLERFFDDWVYRDRGLPDFRIVTAFSRKLLSSTGQGNEYQVTATIENSGGASAEVPVTVHTASGSKMVRVLVRAHDKGYARVEVPVLPTRVVVNDGSVPESNTANNVYEFENKPEP